MKQGFLWYEEWLKIEGLNIDLKLSIKFSNSLRLKKLIACF